SGTDLFNLLPENHHGNYFRRLIGFPAGAFVNLGDGRSQEVPQKLPENVSVSVTIKGTDKPKVTVKKGDQSWGISGADDLKTLPEEIRGYVAAVLAPAPPSAASGFFQAAVDPQGDWDVVLKGRVDWDRDGRPDVYVADQTTFNPRPAASETAFERLDKQIDSLGTQLGELRKAMQELQQSLKTEKGKPSAEEKK